MRDERFAMRVDRKFLELIDNWRRRQPDIPPRAEAVRRLVERGLAKDTQNRGAARVPLSVGTPPNPQSLDRPMTRAEREAIKRALRGPEWEAFRVKNGLNKATMTRAELRNAAPYFGIKP